jgi:hypothetical protein
VPSVLFTQLDKQICVRATADWPEVDREVFVRRSGVAGRRDARSASDIAASLGADRAAFSFSYLGSLTTFQGRLEAEYGEGWNRTLLGQAVQRELDTYGPNLLGRKLGRVVPKRLVW